jgi:hypothetical protein
MKHKIISLGLVLAVFSGTLFAADAESPAKKGGGIMAWVKASDKSKSGKFGAGKKAPRTYKQVALKQPAAAGMTPLASLADLAQPPRIPTPVPSKPDSAPGTPVDSIITTPVEQAADGVDHKELAEKIGAGVEAARKEVLEKQAAEERDAVSALTPVTKSGSVTPVEQHADGVDTMAIVTKLKVASEELPVAQPVQIKLEEAVAQPTSEEVLVAAQEKLKQTNATLGLISLQKATLVKELMVLRNKQHMHKSNPAIFNKEEDPNKYAGEIKAKEILLEAANTQIETLTTEQIALDKATWKAERNILPAPTTNKYKALEDRSILAPSQDAGLLPEAPEAFTKTREAMKALADLDESLTAMKADKEQTPGTKTKIAELEKRIVELEAEIVAIDPQFGEGAALDEHGTPKHSYLKRRKDDFRVWGTTDTNLITLPREGTAEVDRSSIAQNFRFAPGKVTGFNMKDISKEPCKKWAPVNVNRKTDPKLASSMIALTKHDQRLLDRVKESLGRAIYDPTLTKGRVHISTTLQKDVPVNTARMQQELIARTQKAAVVAEIPTVAALHLALKGKVARDEQRRVWTKKELEDRLIAQGYNVLPGLTEKDRARIEESPKLSAVLHSHILANARNARDLFYSFGTGIQTEPEVITISSDVDRTARELEMEAERDRTRTLKDRYVAGAANASTELTKAHTRHGQVDTELAAAHEQQKALQVKMSKLAQQRTESTNALVDAKQQEKLTTKLRDEFVDRRGALIVQHDGLKSEIGKGGWKLW